MAHGPSPDFVSRHDSIYTFIGLLWHWLLMDIVTSPLTGALFLFAAIAGHILVLHILVLE